MSSSLLTILPPFGMYMAGLVGAEWVHALNCLKVGSCGKISYSLWFHRMIPYRKCAGPAYKVVLL